jgi:serine protease inhibitor
MTAIPRRSAARAALCAALALGLPAQAQTRAPNPVAASSNAFAVDFYKALRTRPGNLFFSPINIATAFSMAYSGARGETAAQMRNVLHLTQPTAQNDAATGDLVRDMASKTEGAKLAFANAVWMDKSLTIRPEYAQSLEQNYSAEFPPIAFKADPEGSRATINRWVEDKTAGKIRDLLLSPPEGPMVITSAVYMKADWAKPFNHSATSPADFHVASTSIRAPFMHIKERLPYFDGGSFEAVEIPYTDNLSMVVFVPKQTDGLAALEEGLSSTALEAWFLRLQHDDAPDVSLSLPKYRLTDRIALDPLLKGLGMPLAFNRGKADFSGIATNRADLFIAKATHQSFVSVDEDGTEAAAATAIEIEVTGYRVPAKRQVTVRADHPFLFVILDAHSGAIVFMGRLAKPAS